MKRSLTIAAFALAFPAITFAQDSIRTEVTSTGYRNYDASYNRDGKRFNSWSISIGGGSPFMQSADLSSLKDNGENLFGYSAYFSINKAINHTVGLNLQYDRGEIRQGDFNTKNSGAGIANGLAGRTQYDAISLLADVNLSNLLRRVDKDNAFRWAWHVYGGPGTIRYRTYLKPAGGSQRLVREVKPFKYESVFAQFGTGVKFKVSDALDLEARAMYVATGDDQFDGLTGNQKRNAGNSDNFFNTTLGLTFNLGNHGTHVMWHDPLQEIYYRIDVLEQRNSDVEVCKSGDADNDGVCDDWDRQLDTPAGARVDGAGVALDVDMDGVIDLYDKCPTVPGPVENNGCPYETTVVVTEATRALEGIEFDLDSDRILPSNTAILNNAVSYINATSGNYRVVGGTDTRASDAYNQKLSERRANNVKNYLIQNGVTSGRLEAVGRGKRDLKYPECNPATKCPEWKNRANRRVYFEQK